MACPGRLYNLLGGANMAVVQEVFGNPSSADLSSLTNLHFPPTKAAVRAVFGDRVFEGLRSQRRRARETISKPSEQHGRPGAKQAWWDMMEAQEHQVQDGVVWVPSWNFSYYAFLEKPVESHPGCWYPAILVIKINIIEWWCPKQALDMTYCWSSHWSRVRVYEPPQPSAPAAEPLTPSTPPPPPGPPPPQPWAPAAPSTPPPQPGPPPPSAPPGPPPPEASPWAAPWGATIMLGSEDGDDYSDDSSYSDDEYGSEHSSGWTDFRDGVWADTSVYSDVTLYDIYGDSEPDSPVSLIGISVPHENSGPEIDNEFEEWTLSSMD